MYTQDALQTQVPAADYEDRNNLQAPEQEECGSGGDAVSAGRPLILPPLHKKIYNIFQTRKDTVFETDIQSGLFHSVLLPLLREDAQQTGRKVLVIVPAGFDADGLLAGSGLTAETPERIIDSLRRLPSCFRDTKRVVIACPEKAACADFAADIQFIYGKAGFSPHTLVFTQALHKDVFSIKRLLPRPKVIEKKDITILRPAQGNNAFDAEAVQSFLRETAKKAFEEDPQLLLSYRKLFTKSVPFFSRSGTAAYLLKLLFEKDTVPRFSAARKTPSREDMKLLFFGLGKNRKVFPRDITGLIISKLPEMDRNDIGEIRILDSYSFVEIAEKRIGDVINALNGTEYRGKTLTVNYARKKEDALPLL